VIAAGAVRYRSALFGQVHQPVLQVGDGASELGGVDGVQGGEDGIAVGVAEYVGVVAQQPLRRGGGGVVALGDLGADPGLGHQFLLRRKQIHQLCLCGP